MVLVKPSVEILSMTQNPLQLIELAGRTCYKSESPLTEESSKEFCRMLTKREHLSVVEHAVATVRFVCDRGVSHEIVRHRICSYSQESTRYVDYSKAAQGSHCRFVIPPWVSTVGPGVFTDETVPFATILDESGDMGWVRGMRDAEESYFRLRARGWSPQQARSVLPCSTKTEVVMTANFREWAHFFKLRAVSTAAHPQMREVAIPLLKMFQERVPVIFDGLKVTDDVAL